MCKRGDLVDSIPVTNGIAVAIYHDANSGQWTALARVPTPIGSVEVTATAREDVVSAAITAARQLWCRMMGISDCDPTDAFLDPGPKVAAGGIAKSKVADTVVKIARAAALLHRARLGDPSACQGVNDVVVAAKSGDACAQTSWRIMQALAGLAQIAKAVVPHEVDPQQYDDMVAGYHSGKATLDMVAGSDGSYRVKRSSSGDAVGFHPIGSRPFVGARSIAAGGGRYGLAMRW